MGRANKPVTQRELRSHLDNEEIHPRSASGATTLPSGTENQTLRKGASVWEATSGLSSYTDGQENTLDNDTDGVSRLRNVVFIDIGDEIPLASTTPQGTVLAIRKAT